MTLDDLCKSAGVETFDCGSGWGGRVGIRAAGSSSSTCGYRSVRAAQRAFVLKECGSLGPIVLKLLEKERAK
ncbi:MAG: hypothetical protein ACOY9J_07030 [Pseudomonadota bacterium]